MIYKLNNNELKKEMIEFNKTIYGKCMFLICYSVFFVLFIGLIFSLIMVFINFKIINLLFILPILCLISFVIGSYIFYKELRIYIESKTK